MIKMLDKPIFKNISEYAYNQIRTDILTLVFAPDMKLSEQSIANKLKISKTPIREAMIRLSYEKLLDIYPQRGTFVSRIDFARVSEAYFCRIVLEEKVMNLSLKNIDNIYIRKCEEVLEAHQKIDDDNYIEHFYYDDLFHKTIFESVNKINTWKMLNTLGADYKRIRFLALVDCQKMQDVIFDHRNILDAIVKKDVDSLSYILKNHLQNIYDEINKILENHSQYFKNIDIDKNLIFDKNIFK